MDLVVQILLDNPIKGIDGSLSKLTYWLEVLKRSDMNPVPLNTAFMVH